MATKRKSRGLPSLSPLSARSRSRIDPDFAPVSDRISRTPFSAGALTPALAIKSVTLSDWWLRRTQGKDLAVAGLETNGGPGVRLFSSGAISKRHDSTTLETVDGITVTLCGLINKSRTLHNGFSLEVCNHFLLGFPSFWEDYVVLSCGDEEEDAAENASARNWETDVTVSSLDDMPVSRIRDLLMSPPLKGSEDSLNDVVGRLKDCISQGNRKVSDPLERKGKNSAEVEDKDHDEIEIRVAGRGVETRGIVRQMRLKEKLEYTNRTRNRGTQVFTSEESQSMSRREKKPMRRSGRCSSSVYDDYSEFDI